MPRVGKRRSKEPSTTLGRKHRASFLAPADKDLINNFLLLGWHFDRGQSEASCVYVKLPQSSPLRVFFSAWGTAAS